MKFVSSLVLFGSNGVMAAHIALGSAPIVFLRTLMGAAFLGLALLARCGRRRRARGGCAEGPEGVTETVNRAAAGGGAGAGAAAGTGAVAAVGAVAGACAGAGAGAGAGAVAAAGAGAGTGAGAGAGAAAGAGGRAGAGAGAGGGRGAAAEGPGRRQRARAPRRSWLCVCASGAAMGLSWLFLYEAYRLVGVGVASLAYYCAPVLVMALSPFVFGERLTARRVAALAAAFVGAVLTSGATLSVGGSAWGMACGWASAAAHAAMVVFSKLGDDVDGLESSCAQLAVSFAVAAAYLACTGGLPFAVPAASWPWAAALGVVNTGLGCYLYFSSFGGLSAQTVAVLGYLEPLSAVVCAAVFLGEALTPVQLAGGALIVGGALGGTVAPRAGERAGER